MHVTGTCVRPQPLDTVLDRVCSAYTSRQGHLTQKEGRVPYNEQALLAQRSRYVSVDRSRAGGVRFLSCVSDRPLRRFANTARCRHGGVAHSIRLIGSYTSPLPLSATTHARRISRETCVGTHSVFRAFKCALFNAVKLGRNPTGLYRTTLRNGVSKLGVCGVSGGDAMIFWTLPGRKLFQPSFLIPVSHGHL